MVGAVLTITMVHSRIKWWTYRTNVASALPANPRRFIGQVGQPRLEVPAGQLGKIFDFVIVEGSAGRDSMPIVSAFAAASGDSMESKVDRVGLIASRRGLPTISEGRGSTDAATNVALDSVFEPDAAGAPRVVECFLSERHVPEIMTYTLPLKSGEGRVNVAQVACSRTIKGNEELTALPAAAWAQCLGKFLGESEAVQVIVTHGHRTADLHFLEVFPDARSRRIGERRAPFRCQWWKRP